jgi:hypothetical protein
MDKSQTFASYVYMRVRTTIVSRGIGGRRETGLVSDLPITCCPSLYEGRAGGLSAAVCCDACEQDRLITEMKNELKAKDDEYVKTLKRQAEDIETVLGAMGSQFRELQAALLEELDEIEQSFLQERRELLDGQKGEISNLFERRSTMEAQFMEAMQVGLRPDPNKYSVPCIMHQTRHWSVGVGSPDLGCDCWLAAAVARGAVPASAGDAASAGCGGVLHPQDSAGDGHSEPRAAPGGDARHLPGASAEGCSTQPW